MWYSVLFEIAVMHAVQCVALKSLCVGGWCTHHPRLFIDSDQRQNSVLLRYATLLFIPVTILCKGTLEFIPPI